MTFSYSTYQCNVCRQTEILSRQMNQQAKDANRRHEMEQSRQAMQRAMDEYNQAYAETQAYRAPYQSTYQNTQYTPPEPVSPEDRRMHYALTRKLKILEILFWSCPIIVLPLLWIITSGWFTVFAFLVSPVAWIGLGKWLEFWRMSNAYYLYSIRDRVALTR